MAPSEHPAFSPQKLKSRLREAAAQPVAFTFGIDKSGKEPVLLLHDKLTGKPLLQFLKSKKEAVVLGTYGEAKLEGKRLYLYAEKNLKSFVKLCKLWVSTNKHPMITKIIPVVGGVELTDGDDKEATEAGPDAARRNGQPQAALVERQQKFSNALKKALKNTSGKLDNAQLKAVGTQAVAAIEAGDFERAKKIIEALAAANSTAKTASSQNSINFGKLAEDWISIRQSAERDIASLRAMAMKAYPHLADQLSTLEGTFKPFNRELGRTLKAASVSKDADQTQKLATRAAVIAREYHASLRADLLVTHLKKNPFKNIDLFSKMSGPLENVIAAVG